jgi:flagellar hook-basal body protein
LRPWFADRLAARIEFGDDVMGIFDALNTSVSGLQAQSFALQNISGNIANSSTVGYKGIGTSFEDLVPQSTTPDKQMAGGVTAHAQASISTQGTVSATAVATNMAISGVGFFNVQKPIGVTDNVAVFDGVTDYTRRGDFQLNANGNLVNGAGYYLLGVTVDPKTGNPIGNVPQVLQFQNNFIPAQATTKITYAANLPTRPSTVASSTAATGTLTALGGLNPADFTPGFNPQVIGTPATPFTDATVTGSAVNNKAAVPAPITGATALSGAAGTNSLTANFGVGDTITVDGTVVTFVAAGAVGNQLNVTDNVTTMLAKIDSITGTANPSTVAGGAIGFARLTTMAFGGTDLRPLRDKLIAKVAGGTAGAGEGLDLSLITQLLGDKLTGTAIQAEVLAFHQLFRSPCSTDKPKLRVLALAADIDMGGNTPIEFLLEDSGIELKTLYVIPGVGLPSPLPDHDVAIVIASDSDECRDALDNHRPRRGPLAGADAESAAPCLQSGSRQAASSASRDRRARYSGDGMRNISAIVRRGPVRSFARGHRG